MRVIAIAVLANAADRVERFVREHLLLVDHMLIADDNSKDGTGELLLDLQQDGLPISVRQVEAPLGTRQGILNHLLSDAIENHGAGWVIPLEMDEILTVKNRGLLEVELAQIGHRHGQIPIVGAPSKSPSDEAPLDWKVIVNARLLRPYLDRYCLADGNHGIAFREASYKSEQPAAELRHAKLMRRTSAAPNAIRRRVVIFSGDRQEEACAQIRLLQPFALLANEWEVVWAVGYAGGKVSIDCTTLDQADLVVIQRLFPKPLVADVLDQIFSSGAPVVYEMDDRLLDVPPDHPKHDSLVQRLPILRDTMARADLLVVSTEPLRAALAGQARKVILLPNCVDTRLFQAPVPPPGKIISIGIAGTPTHAPDYEMVAQALVRVLDHFPSRIRIKFLGDPPPPTLAGHAAVSHMPYTSSYASHAARLRGLGLEIALVPLVDNSFNRAKSNIKWLEYSASGIAGIFSDLPPYACVRHGETGLRVQNTEQAWFDAIVTLIEQPEMRMRIALAAQKEVIEGYSAQAGMAAFAAVYRDALNIKHLPLREQK